MLTREGDVDAHALHRRGWTISAIARHHDRKTIRAYLHGGGLPGSASAPCRTRLSLWVPETRLTSCNLLIFVEEVSESA